MKPLFIFLIIISSLYSASFSARYSVNVSMFGSVGYIDIELVEDADKYTMTMIASTTGTAAVLTKDRLETYISQGKIVNKKYIPNSFEKIKKTSHRFRSQLYTFDHEKKTVTIIEKKEKMITKTSFDPISFKMSSKEVKEISEKSNILDYYRENDVLSSFLNTTKSFDKPKKYNMEAIGAYNHKKDVSLYLLSDEQKEKVAENFSKNIGKVCNLNVTPFDKNDTVIDILIAFDDKGKMKEAVLGDIFWVGKITAQRLDNKFTCK